MTYQDILNRPDKKFLDKNDFNFIQEAKDEDEAQIKAHAEKEKIIQ